MMKWLIRISNSHHLLSQIELEGLIGESGVEWIHQLLAVVDCSEHHLQGILDEAVSIKYVIKQPIIVAFDEFALDFICNTYQPQQHDIQGSFAIKFKEIMAPKFRVPKNQYIDTIAHLLHKHHQPITVNLKDPENRFYCIAFEDKIAAGWVHSSFDFTELSRKSPKESPFFGGGAMKAMLTKILVNLLSSKTAIVLDPFCGHGGFLRAIADQNHFALGLEIKSTLARECRINNEYLSYDGKINVLIADATKPPYRRNSVSDIVTDPPYAIQTTTKGKDKEDLISQWLGHIERDTRIVFTLPDTVQLGDLQDWNVSYEITDYVHSSLTRVVRKMIKVRSNDWE